MANKWQVFSKLFLWILPLSSLMIIIWFLSLQKRLSKTFETVLRYSISNSLMQANQNLLQLMITQKLAEMMYRKDKNLDKIVFG